MVYGIQDFEAWDISAVFLVRLNYPEFPPAISKAEANLWICACPKHFKETKIGYNR